MKRFTGIFILLVIAVLVRSSDAGWKNMGLTSTLKASSAIGMNRGNGTLYTPMGTYADGTGRMYTITYPGIAPVLCSTLTEFKNPWGLHAFESSMDGSKMVFYEITSSNHSVYTVDGGVTWHNMGLNVHGIVYGTLHWESGMIIGFSGEYPTPQMSLDTGKTWTEITSFTYSGSTNLPISINGQPWLYTAIGIFSPNAVVRSCGEGILRSTDTARTWTTVTTAYNCVGRVQVIDGLGYWFSKTKVAGHWMGQIITSADSGKTWQPFGAAIDNGDSMYMSSPKFGENVGHIFVAARRGILESKDSGNTWTLLAPYLNWAMCCNSGESSVDTQDGFEYDPVHNLFYLYVPWYAAGSLYRYQPAVAVEEKKSVADKMELESGDPNPFNPGTFIRFRVPQSTKGVPVSLKVYSHNGSLVKTLVDGATVPGAHIAWFDGKDRNGRVLGSGTYLCVLKGNGYQRSVKLVLMK